MVKRKCYFRQNAVDRPFDKGTFEQKPEDVGKEAILDTCLFQELFQN